MIPPIEPTGLPPQQDCPHPTLVKDQGQYACSSCGKITSEVHFKALPRQPKTCTIPDCEERSHVRGYCIKHYSSFNKYGDPLKAKRIIVKHGDTCAIDGCDRPYWSRGVCKPHYAQFARAGKLDQLRHFDTTNQ